MQGLKYEVLEVRADGVHVCLCGVEVPEWRALCAECQEKQRKADRAMLLRKAYASLPAMPWAVWGSLDGVCRAPIVAAIRAWKAGDQGLILAGPSGSGKTSACVAKLRRILDLTRDKQVSLDKFRFAARIRFAVAADLALARRKWKLGDGESPAIEEAIGASLLVLDELGYEPTSDTAIPEIIDARSRRAAPTIVTTGLRFAEIQERYGEATARKMICRGKVVEAW